MATWVCAARPAGCGALAPAPFHPELPCGSFAGPSRPPAQSGGAGPGPLHPGASAGRRGRPRPLGPYQQLSFRTLCSSEALARDRTIFRVSFMAERRGEPRPPPGPAPAPDPDTDPDPPPARQEDLRSSAAVFRGRCPRRQGRVLRAHWSPVRGRSGASAVRPLKLALRALAPPLLLRPAPPRPSGCAPSPAHVQRGDRPRRGSPATG